MNFSITGGVFHGTYGVRKLGRDQGIHLPPECSGRFSIYMDSNGIVVMVPMDKK